MKISPCICGNTPTIFRVQDKEGRGPWRPGFSHLWVVSRKDHDNLPPWFSEFPKITWTGDYFGCGCTTIKQLRRWFTKREYTTLHSFGFRAVSMEADDILAQSEVQCVFSKQMPLNVGISPVKLY